MTESNSPPSVPPHRMHPQEEDLSWSLIGRAASGDRAAREDFSLAYLPVVRRFLEARWRGTPWAVDMEDAVQEVFVECLRAQGALERADARRGELGGFLFGVARKVALRFEERARDRRVRDEALGSAIDLIEGREPTLSRLFDREWARTMMRLAGERMRNAAREKGSDGARLRAELLRLRFGEGLPIREIAARWKVEPRSLHKAYEKARVEFRMCLSRVLAEHGAAGGGELDSEVKRILHLLD